MIDGNKTTTKKRIHHIKALLRARDIRGIFSHPINVLIFVLLVIRALFLRVVPHTNCIYFIRRDIILTEENGKDDSKQFRIFREFGKELDEFAVARSGEDRNCFYKDYQRDIVERLKKGSAAHALLMGGKIVSVFFAMTGPCRIDSVNYTYIPAQEEVAIIDIYTLVGHRNKGLYSQLLRRSQEAFRAGGALQITMWIMKHNRATIHAQMKNGFLRVFRIVRCVSWLGLDRTRVWDTDYSLEHL